MMTRRQMVLGAAGGAGLAALLAAGTLRLFGPGAKADDKAEFEVTKTKAEWKESLTPEQYAVLREADTERPYSSVLNNEKRKGTYACAGCDLPLFSSETKFESGTGWPSFYTPIEGAVATQSDGAFGLFRTEVHCRRCGGHLGHVFDDGPKPTGLRYCMNGVAMKFVPASSTS